MKLTIMKGPPLRPGGHPKNPQSAGTGGYRQKWVGKYLLLAAGGLILAGCAGPVLAPTLTPTAPASPTPTATILWFPPTDTPTATSVLPATPTMDERPGMGDLLFSDSFDDPAFWNTASSAQASAILTNNRLVLSITQPGPLSITSRRDQPSLSDFYAEATANISLCSSKDQYGMLFRASTSADYYRFVLNCSGQERLERISGGVTYPLLDWLASNAAPVGAPAQIKLGVWAVGREMRLFLNDQYQFSMTDPIFSAGTIGFFAYANGKSPVTISFSDLSAYSISYILPTPSPAPSWTPIPAATRKP